MSKQSTIQRPKTIQIAYRTFRIVDMDDLTAGEYCGRGNRDKGLIVIAPKLDGEVTTNTVLHELIHSILSVWREGEEPIAEGVVASLANGLHTCWKDNPKLFKWFTQEIGRALSQ